ncbi:MAG TPA: PadR family transcriptional regulator, partial [Thermoplasmata archaeon]|nr:PadR family transcriptional regulator [Thermoplasmata archaeon]
MTSQDGFGGTHHFLAKGDFTGLLLVVLREKPMHGYEVMKALEERFHGFYKPSPGAIYPALRSL